MSKAAKLQKLKNNLESHLSKMQDMVEQSMLSKGNTVSECQRVAVIAAIKNLEMNINGIEESDLL